jgi:hypothetical protein
VERLADLASREERKDHELLLQSELLKCLKAAANHKQVWVDVGMGAPSCRGGLRVVSYMRVG